MAPSAAQRLALAGFFAAEIKLHPCHVAAMTRLGGEPGTDLPSAFDSCGQRRDSAERPTGRGSARNPKNARCARFYS